jgi:5-methylcytosine-specific restriction endonuclease McrA
MFAAALRQTHREKVRKYHSDRRYKEKLSLSPGSPMWWKKKYGYNRVREIYVGATWEQLKVLYENTPFCFYCGIAVGPTEMCFDHRIPRSRGGATGISNICVACPGCNRLKWNLTPDEFETYQLAYVMQVLKHRDAKRQKFTQAEKRA